MQKTSYNSHIWFVNNMFDWRQTCALVAITETWPPLTMNMFYKREELARATSKRFVFFHALFHGIMLADFESKDVQIQP